MNSLVVGDGFGCAAAATRGRWEWQCWQAPDRDQSAPLRAFRVPWLEDKDLQAGPDRVCEFARPALTFRCWERPQRGESVGRELPAHWQWLNPNGARWAEAFDRADWVREVSLGGSFACLTNAKSSVWCLGDNRFAQLGGSQPVPPPDAERDHPAFVRHISVQGWSLALGTWRACAACAVSRTQSSASAPTRARVRSTTRASCAGANVTRRLRPSTAHVASNSKQQHPSWSPPSWAVRHPKVGLPAA